MRLYNKRSDCCGCGICSLNCPKHAITMETDSEGFVYPIINNKECIDCGLCVKQCPHGKTVLNEPVNSYAASNTDVEQKAHSTSAGVFAAIATAFLEKGGLVCGAAMFIKNGQADVKHIMISSVGDLPKLQGSKYVKSDITDVIPQISVALARGESVLFSGTPCQVSGVKSMFKNTLDKLYTIDIICHGVPSLKFFNDYLQYIQKSSKKQLIDFCFRDKELGWGHRGSVTFEADYEQKRVLSPDNSSYYSFFYKCEILRDSCYRCPYACKTRIGDLTIGDYWGAEQFNPELMSENGGPFVLEEGISCILENTTVGTELFGMTKDRIESRAIALDNILVVNTQLKAPAIFTKKRSRIFSIYCSKGYGGVEKLFKRWSNEEKLIRIFRKLVPQTIKNIIKTLLNL